MSTIICILSIPIPFQSRPPLCHPQIPPHPLPLILHLFHLPDYHLLVLLQLYCLIKQSMNNSEWMRSKNNCLELKTRILPPLLLHLRQDWSADLNSTATETTRSFMVIIVFDGFAISVYNKDRSSSTSTSRQHKHQQQGCLPSSPSALSTGMIGQSSPQQ